MTFPFHGTLDGTEDPQLFIEDVTIQSLSLTRHVYEASLTDRIALSIFRRNLAGRAKLWYSCLDHDTKRDWLATSGKFQSHFNIRDHDISDDEKRAMVKGDLKNLKQGEDESIEAYLERCEDLYVRVKLLLVDEKVKFDTAVISGIRFLDTKADILSAMVENDGLGGFQRVKRVVRALRNSQIWIVSAVRVSLA